jgi:dihydropteroate synthase
MEQSAYVWRAGPQALDCRARTLVMGILNVTPDSFSDGGQFFDPETAVSRGIEMVSDGADIIDVGGESTRPGSDPVSVDAELERVVPVIKRLAAEVQVPISVDTRRHQVAEAAVDAGAAIVNDVTAGSDPEMFPLVRDRGVGMVLMHMKGEPKTMQQNPEYNDVVREVHDYLEARVQAAVDAEVSWEQLCVDPGLGFGKTTDHSLLLMKETDTFSDLGRPVLVGPSRKSFIGDALGTEVTDRLDGTAGAVAYMVAKGAHIVRVHDVREIARVVRVVDAILRA